MPEIDYQQRLVDLATGQYNAEDALGAGLYFSVCPEAVPELEIAFQLYEEVRAEALAEEERIPRRQMGKNGIYRWEWSDGTPLTPEERGHRYYNPKKKRTR